MSDPVQHVFCGHGEVLVKVQEPLVDVDDALVAFGDATKSARRTYLRRMKAALAEENRGEVSDRLPWWKPDRGLVPSTGRPSVDVLGRSSCLDRAPLGADDSAPKDEPRPRSPESSDLARIKAVSQPGRDSAFGLKRGSRSASARVPGSRSRLRK